MGTRQAACLDDTQRWQSAVPGIDRAGNVSARASADGEGARESGTPFVSFFTPTEMRTLARQAGFREFQHVSAATPTQRYIGGQDGWSSPAK
jgi:hypothetical protein